MVEIGGRPIIWHIMKAYFTYGVSDFVVAAGYRSNVIKEYFSSYHLNSADVTIDLATGQTEVHAARAEEWRVTVAETGYKTMTGGRLRRVRPYLADETFCLTYGDCLSDLDLGALIDFHRAQGRLATVTAVQPPGRFGALILGDDEASVERFHEKPEGDGGWINGGFFVLEPGAIDYIEGDQSVWEREPMEALARDGQLAAYRHTGFWQPMDSLRDKVLLENLWAAGSAPWWVW
jgi:glucose-1-phosphate cytidylyltransferase